MTAIGKILNNWLKFLLVIILAIAMTGCGVAKIQPGPEPLPFVASLPMPQLPDWIKQISPTGEAQTLAQIRIRFKEPLIPVERIDTPQQKSLLKKFEVLPPIPGEFRFLTPRMVGFQTDRALPKATRIRVTLKAGLADLNNHRLEEDLAWTFNTEPIKLTNLPRADDPIDINPTLEFTSNVELDPASVKENLTLIPEGKEEGLPLQVALKPEEYSSDYQSPHEKFDPSSRNWTYTIKPRPTLSKATRYRLEFAAGLRPSRGNLASDKSFTSEVLTYAALTFERLEYYGQPDAWGAYGRFVQGSPELKFNNVLVADSAVENISLNPAPKKNVDLVRAYDYSNLVSLNPWALEPATTYTITIGADLKDQFGQTLDKPVTLTYETGDIAPDIWAPSDLNIFPAGKNLQLNISTVNLPESNYQAAYQVVQPTDLVYVDSAYPRETGTDLLPPPAQWSSFRDQGRKNQTHEHLVPLRKKLGGATGMLAYGVKAKTNRYQQEDGKSSWREPKFYGLVQLTNLGVFAQWFPDSGFVRVNHLSDGSAVENAAVEIYRSQLDAKSKSQPIPCATVQTDMAGMAMIEGTEWQKCLQNREAPELLVIAREGQDWAFTRTDQYSGSYEYGIYAGWDEGEPLSRGVIFSDRQLYQPGEKAGFTGTAYYLQNGTLKQDKNAPYQVTLTDADGKETDLGTQTTNKFGTFSFELPLEKNWPLGYYSLRAQGKSGVEIEGEFRLAEFKPPNFQVELTLNQELALTDQKVGIATESNYFFGSPVQGGKVSYYVTRERTNFIPQGWDKFNFGRQWFWPEEPPEVLNEVLQATQVLDAAGQNRQEVAVAKDLPYPMTYRVEAEVTDVSNLSVSERKTFTALPSDRLIGLQGDFVATAGQPLPVKVIVTDPEGKVISGERVRVELQEMKYSRVTQLQEGSRTSRDQIEYKTIAQEEVLSQPEPQEISFTPPESGSYRIQANLVNSKSDVTATDLQIWATGENEVYWGDRYDNNRLEIKLDRENYRPGETATALIKSPYSEGELYLAVVRHNTIYSTIQKVTGGAPKIQFKVTEEMLPNAAVEAVLVRQGKPLSQTEPSSVSNLVSIGFAPFNINLEEKYLQVQVTPQQAKREPGQQQTIDLELKDHRGNLTPGQFTVMVVNEAVLQLTGYRPPDLVKTVYAQQDISTRLADNRPEVVLTAPTSPLEKGWGYGGGLSAGAGSTEIRQDFRPLAYYNGSVVSDAQGKASVTFTLPDDLTTWRVMAVATDGELHFGQGDATFITTKPLATNPVLPQFVRLGDRFLGGVAVTNTTGATGNLTINGSVSKGLKLAETSTVTTQAASATKAYRFPIVAETVGEAKVQFFTQLGDGETDAFEVPLEVKKLEITEQSIDSGTTEKEFTIPLNVDDKVVANTGGLEISLASTLIPEITAPAGQVFEADEFPFLEPSASQLGVAANLQILSQKYAQAFTNLNLNQRAAQALENLQQLQQADGGFAFFPRAETADPFITPYAAETIAQAQAAGFAVNSEMVSRLQDYLKKILANPNKHGYCTSTSCKNQIRLEALMALTELGEKRQDFLPSLYEGRSKFNFVNQVKLARYLSQFPEWQAEAQSLFQEVQETIYETGRTATVNLPQGWRWFNSHTAAQAQALRLFMAQNAPGETLDRLLQGLLAKRREGIWGNNYDNAQALTALVAYSQLESVPPDFKATVQLARKQLAKVQFKGYGNPNYELKVPMQELPRGRNNLILQKSGTGTLHYLTAYRYRLTGNQPGQLNGLRVTRYLRRANQDQVLYKQGLYAPDEPLKVPAGQVFDIGLEIITDHPVDHLAITDPLPAGLEAVDTSFQTAIASLQAQQDSWQIGYQQIYRDKVVAYGSHLDAGVYSLHYLVRSVTPGTFEWPGAEVHLQYAPEEFGRSASSSLEVVSPDTSK
jgi:uncharacterized protein YfaS (alpha-2-macroglobulin family)